jgi:hypothetical protein
MRHGEAAATATRAAETSSGRRCQRHDENKGFFPINKQSSGLKRRQRRTTTMVLQNNRDSTANGMCFK